MHRWANLVLAGLLLALAALPSPTLAQPGVLVGGSVRFADGQPVAGAKVLATRFDTAGSAQATTLATGAYSMTLDPGQWQLVVETPSDTTPWMFTDEPTPLDLTITGAPGAVDLTVSRTAALVVGRVLADTGEPLPLPPAGSPARPPVVKLYSDIHFGVRRAPLDATGFFTAPLVAGDHLLQLELDPSEAPYTDYAQLPPIVVTVPASGTLDTGDLTLALLRNATLAGVVRGAGGVGVAGVPVQAVRVDGGSSLAVSGADGVFSMPVAAGTWDVSALPDADAYVSAGAVTTAQVAAGGTVSVTLTLTPAAGRIDGALARPGGAVAGDAGGWAYARRADSGAIVAYAQVDAGRFTLRVPAGSLRVGVLLPAGSPYTLAGEQTPALARALARADMATARREAAARAPYERAVMVAAPAGAPGLAATTTVTLPLLLNDRRITGVVRNPAGALPDATILVSAAPASPGATPQTVVVNRATGAFTLDVSAGTWRLNYLIRGRADGFARALPAPVSVTIGVAQQEATRDLDLLVLDGVVRGTLQDEAGRPLAGLQVWASSGLFSGGAESAADGSFSVPVPLAGGQPARYRLVVDATCAPSDCLLDLGPLDVLAEPVAAAGVAQSGPGRIYSVRRPRDQTTVTIRGRVEVDGNVNGLNVIPSFKSSNGGESDTTNSSGEFTTRVYYGGQVSRVNGDLRVTKSSGKSLGKFKFKGVDVSIQSLQQAGEVEIIMGPVAGFPAPVAATFDIDQGWSFTLGDGMSIRIPPGAVPAGATGSSAARVVVEPTLELPIDARFSWGASYGYSVRVFNVNAETGQILAEVNEPLSAPAELVMGYTLDDLESNSAAPGRLRAARLEGAAWAPAEHAVLEGDRVAVQTTLLGTWAIVQERDLCASCLILPHVWVAP